MRCPACGAENADGNPRCISCRLLLDGPGTVTVRVSGAAKVSAAFALITCVTLLAMVVSISSLPIPSWLRALAVPLFYFAAMTCCLGLFCGVIGMVSIGTSGGRTTGHGWAVIGVLISICTAMIFYYLTVFPRGSSAYRMRMMCISNLSAIGKTMLVYAGDHDDRFPVAGGSGTVWGAGPADWSAEGLVDAFGCDPNGAGGVASISSSLYLLVRYTDISPKYFVCPSERGVKDFDLAKYRIKGKELTDVWDFGPNPAAHCSYAYRMPFDRHMLTTASQINVVVLADRNPWLASPSGKARDFVRFTPDVSPFNGTAEEARNGNSKAHHGDGQAVAFLDSSVEFIPRSYPAQRANRVEAVDNDNIYTSWDGQDHLKGVAPRPFDARPADRLDALLLNDPPRPR